MKSFDIPRLRQGSQLITGPRASTPDEVVRRLGALQAQDYMQSVWAIALRTRDATLADVEQAIEERKILRTWPMRGTIHFVPPEDAGWMLTLSAARMIASDKRRLEQLELDYSIIERCKGLLHDALEGGKRLSRPDVMSLLEGAGVSTAGQRGYHILWHLAQSGLICLGPMQGKQQTFVLLDEWVPIARRPDREEALSELAGRYFAGHGPATVHDFAWWSGLAVRDAQAGLESISARLISEKVGGKEMWMADTDAASRSSESRGVHLLAGFDEYLLGYRDRTAVLAPEHSNRVVPGGNGVFLPVIVVDGQIAGTWRRAIKKNSVDITYALFSSNGSVEDGIKKAAERYSAFLELALSSVRPAV
jgi:hypothetical protein